MMEEVLKNMDETNLDEETKTAREVTENRVKVRVGVEKKNKKKKEPKKKAKKKKTKKK
jgi:hypothetical protein